MEYKEEFANIVYFVKGIVICFFYLASAIVYLIHSTCTSIECQIHPMRYVNRINSKVIYEDESAGRPVCAATHTKPFTAISGLYARTFTAISEKIEIQHSKVARWP